MDQLGKYLKELRENKSKSIRKASEKIGISHTYLDSLEKGFDPRTGKKRKPTPEVLRKISKYYGVSYLLLLGLAGYMEEEKRMSNEDWDQLTKALTIEDEDELSINKIRAELALGKVFTLYPDERLSNEDSERVSSIMTKVAFLLYHGPEHWGTDPLLKEVQEVIDIINERDKQ